MKAVNIGCVLLIGAALSACGFKALKPELREQVVSHVLNIDMLGNYVPTIPDDGGPFRHYEGRMIDARQVTRDAAESRPYEKFSDRELERRCLADELHTHVDRMLKRMDAYHARAGSGPKKVMIFVHGGLNEFPGSIGRAARQFDDIQAAGYHPIFINWESEGASSYGEHLVRTRHGEADPDAFITAPVYLLVDVLKVIGNAPKAWVVSGYNSYTTTLGRDEIDGSTARVGRCAASGCPTDSADQCQRHWCEYHIRIKGSDKDELPGTVDALLSTSQSGSGVISRSLWTLTSPFKLLSTPIVYTLGEPAWDTMLRRSKVLFRKHAELDGLTTLPLCYEWYKRERQGSGALAVFLYRLEEHLDQGVDPQGAGYEVTIVGHSMGAIVVADILEEFPGLARRHVRNVVFMGAAASIREVKQHVEPFLLGGDDKQFYSLSLHPRAEDRELSLGGFTPSGSLLVWVDNMFSTPETVLDRRVGRWQNVQEALHVFAPRVRDQMHFKVFGFEQGDPLEHGDFSGDAYWTRDYWE